MTDCHEPATSAARRWLNLFGVYEGSEEASENLKEKLEDSRRAMPCATFSLVPIIRSNPISGCSTTTDGPRHQLRGTAPRAGNLEDQRVVVNTAAYCNIGGQSSKATPLGAVAQFAASGKKSAKKDLGAMFMAYGNVYVAQVSMGASPSQLLTALREASEYRGPSLVIAYAPCTAHGIRAGMAHAQQEMKKATESGYWPLYRYHPGHSRPFTLDSGTPDLSYEDFLNGENRYAALRRTFPDLAEELFARAGREAERRHRRYEELAALSDDRKA